VYLREQIEGYQRRQRRFFAGHHGWAQINQGYDTTVDDVTRKVRYDLEYIRRQSAFEDLRIMLRTLPVMVLRRGGCEPPLLLARRARARALLARLRAVGTGFVRKA